MGYNDANLPTSESYTNGLLNGFAVIGGYNAYFQRHQLALGQNGTYPVQQSFGYDAYRLKTATDGMSTATYDYTANSPLVSQIAFAYNGSNRLTTVKQYDGLNRTISVQNTTNGLTVASYGYQYNQANQRTSVTLADNSQWRYGYDSLGQATSGKRYWSDSTPVEGQQFEYLFDDIGNRKTASSGGNPQGTGLRTSAYTAELINKYSSRTVPGSVDVIGEANASATVAVTVNSQPVSRHGEYYRASIDVANSVANVWQGITNTAVLNRSGTSDLVTQTSGGLLVPKNPQPFQYDDDGNLINDSVWNYTWDAENRLIAMDLLVAGPAAQHLTFEYDWRGRRIRKQVQSAANPDIRYLYDGWNLVAEIKPDNTVLRGYLWGLDLSGSMQGAGGVGGLLAVYDAASVATYFTGFDANGNVAALVKASDGSVCANYEYGPFGELIRASGPMAKANPFRFSTKFTDDETDLVYYGYRYYSPSLGRWLSRDPLQENGASNLYGFLGNDPNNQIDLMGLSPIASLGPNAGNYLTGKPPKPAVPSYPGETVVTVPVPDPKAPDNGFLAKNINNVVNNSSDKGYTFVLVPDPAEFNKRLKKVCGCIGNLTITGHGGGGTQLYGSGQSTERDRTLTVTYPPHGQPPKVQNIDIFNGVNFCKPCSIVLAGCSVATGPDWTVLFQTIHEKTGCAVSGYTTLGTCPSNGTLPGPTWPGHWETIP